MFPSYNILSKYTLPTTCNLFCFAVFFFASPLCADEPKTDDLAAKLKEYAEKQVLPKDFDSSAILARDVRARLKEANERDYEAWSKIKTKADWEKFRDEKIAALKKSLGEFPEPPKNMAVRVTKTIQGDGYKIENTLFESRPGFWVTANIYSPAKPQAAMPGILIVHSHHNPKTEGELQDMGVTWARAGCCVLVMDQLGHGERRQHPFNDAKSYPEPFRVSRQDYQFRYNLGMQLGLVGESLIGWMAWDLMRGVDVLLKKPGIDPEKIILLGAVAGGGDPAGVTAALDPRIKCVVPFNFGGPQPETKPLGEDAAKTFNYAGGGSWESTRNLRNSARDGFLPWVIVASIAPRHLIYAHEFSWFGDRDPVYQRYQRIWSFYDAKDRVGLTHGFGTLTSKDPVGSHCNNIGPEHRKAIHVAFEKWFGIKAVESKERHTSEELRCWTDEAKAELKPKMLSEVLGAMAQEQIAAANRTLERLKSDELPGQVRSDWIPPLGLNVVFLRGGLPPQRPLAPMEKLAGFDVRGCTGWSVEIAPNCQFVVVEPSRKKDDQVFPAVIVVCRQGSNQVLKERSQLIAELIHRDIVVILPNFNVPGSNALTPNLGRSSSSTSLSSSANMAAQSLLTNPMWELNATLRYLRNVKSIDGDRIALIGESLAPVNAADRLVAVPHDAPTVPAVGDPFGGMLATFTALFDPKIKAVAIRGGVFNFRSTLQSPFVYLPHDALIPGGIGAGDLETVYGSLAPRALRFEGMIDAHNKRLTAKALKEAVAPIQTVYDKNGKGSVETYPERQADANLAAWISKMLAK